MTLTDINTCFTELESLYLQLPEVACTGCGRCCVSPTCTLAEFLYMMNRSISTLPAHDLKTFILAAPTINNDHEGNLDCVFLRQSQCTIHKVRSGACRLFGIPSINEMGIADLVSCFNKIEVTSGEYSEAFIKSWLEKIIALNEKIYPFGSEPFHVYGFNIECWLDIYFDTTIADDFFSNIREIMKQCFNLEFLSGEYTSKTGLKEKIDKIIILPFLLDSGDVPVIRETLLSIKDNYPLTGTYFYKEAQTLLDALPIDR